MRCLSLFLQLLLAVCVVAYPNEKRLDNKPQLLVNRAPHARAVTLELSTTQVHRIWEFFWCSLSLCDQSMSTDQDQPTPTNQLTTTDQSTPTDKPTPLNQPRSDLPDVDSSKFTFTLLYNLYY